MKLVLTFENSAYKFDFPSELYWQKLATTIAVHLEKSQKLELNLNIVSPKTMRELNKLHYPCSEESNILSLKNLAGDRFSDGILGEVYLNYELMMSQTKTHNKDWISEITEFFIHSVLHLFGFTHENEKEHKVMAELITAILKK